MDKSSKWTETLKTNELLADIYDLLQVINVNLVNLGGGKKKKIEPYPRPGKDDDKKRKIGKGAMPLDDLRDWIRRRQNGKR